MMKFNALDLIPTIAALRSEVILHRAACQTDFARNVHDTLVAALDQISTELLEEVTTEQQLASEKGTPDGSFFYEIYRRCTPFEGRWIAGGPISLIDDIYTNAKAENETCRLGLQYAVVPNSDLEGLADLLDVIFHRTAIQFVAACI